VRSRMRSAKAGLALIRGELGSVTGELIDTETVTISSEGGRWKVPMEVPRLAAYLTACVVRRGERSRKAPDLPGAAKSHKVQGLVETVEKGFLRGYAVTFRFVVILTAS